MKIVLDLPSTLIKDILGGEIDLIALDDGGSISFIEEQNIQIQADKTIKEAFIDLSKRASGQNNVPDIALRAPNPFSDMRAKEIIKEGAKAKAKKPLTMVDVIRQIPNNRLVKAARNDAALQDAIIRAYEGLPKSLWGTADADAAVESVWNIFRKSGG